MTSIDARLRFAIPSDLLRMHALIERAFRGGTAREGWTHEADLLDDQRIEIDELAAIINSTDERLLLIEREVIVGCVRIADKGNGTCYLGLLCVEPQLQTSGLGKQLLAAAETHAADLFGASEMELTVIAQRLELIRYYERRGYRRTGERRPFPVPRTPPLEFIVLTKSLQ